MSKEDDVSDEHRHIIRTSAITGSAQVVSLACAFGRAKGADVFDVVGGVGMLVLTLSALNVLSDLA